MSVIFVRILLKKLNYNELTFRNGVYMNRNLSNIRAQAFDYTINGVVITDYTHSDNPIIDVNKTFEAMTGYSRGEILCRNCRFMQAYDNRQPGLTKLRLALYHQEECKVELKNYRKDGSMFWNELTVIPIFKNAKLAYYLGIMEDVTAAHNVLASLTKTVEQLDQVNAMMVHRELQLLGLKQQIIDLKELTL